MLCSLILPVYVQWLFHLVIAGYDLDYGALCPYSNLCHTDALSVRQSGDEKWPCCVQCSCADNCYLFKRCCPDKILKTRNDTENEDNDSEDIPLCRSQQELYNRYFGTQNYYSTADFHVITSCPEIDALNNTLNEAVYRCYNGNGTLQNAHFVSDVNNETLYFNKYCAQCNGVENVVHWLLKADCSGKMPLLKLRSEEERDNHTIYNCDIMSIPPSEEIGLKFLCHTDAKHVCNATGRWNFYDPELERNCKKYDIAYTGNTQFSYTSFRVMSKFANVYCFLCNMPKGTLIENTCPNPFFSVPRTVLYPFTYIIVNANNEKKSLIKNETVCKFNEIWDQLMLKCRDLLCPMGTIPSYEECVPLVDKVNGMSFDVFHQFNLTVDQYEDLGIDHASFLDMISQLTYIDELQSRGCLLCIIQTAVVTSGFIASATTITSTESCSIKTALQILHSSTKSGVLHLNTKTHNLDIEFELIYRQSLYDEFTNTIYNTVLYKCRRGEMFTLDLVYCPSFKFENHELLSSGIDNTFAERVISKSSMSSPNTYIICQSQYRELIKEFTSGSRSLIHGYTILIVLVGSVSYF